MPLHKIIRQLAETLTPTTGVHRKWPPQGAEEEKGGQACSQGRWGQEVSRGAGIKVQKRSSSFSKNMTGTLILESNTRLDA